MSAKPPGPALTPLQSFYLDLLRAIAALFVLVGHAASYFLPDTWLNTASIQIFGVLVFFLLSGFLITYSVFQKHGDPSYGFRPFFIDRFARIYTAFIPALVLIAIIDHFAMPYLATTDRADLVPFFEKLHQNFDVKTWFGNLFMLQNFPAFPILKKLGVDPAYLIGSFGSAVPLWTISIEWWIYMGFGLLAVQRFKTGQPFRLWQWPVLLFVMIVPVYHAMGGYDECLTLLWMLGMGAAIAFRKAPHFIADKNLDAQRLRRIALIVALCAALMACGRLLSRYMDMHAVVYPGLHFGTFLAIAVFAMLFALGRDSRVPALIAKPVKFVADYSFSLYLIHHSIINYLALRFPRSEDHALFWQSLVLCNLAAIACWWLFERHYRTVARWLKRATARA